MELVPDIDEQASRNNARRLLKNYRRIARMAGRRLQDIQSPTISDMPRSEVYGNLTEIRMINTFNAQQELNAINDAIGRLPFQSCWVLFYSYCTPGILSGWEIAARVNLANDRAVEYARSRALLLFAEAYPQLLVFKE